jgi:NAD(P)-dependent dehydrogenase (short-subunit alcohol dehydrogenase family)
MELRDQVAVVSGGASGIGAAVVERLRAAGARNCQESRPLDNLPAGEEESRVADACCRVPGAHVGYGARGLRERR